jgi:hypothetical protein
VLGRAIPPRLAGAAAPLMHWLAGATPDRQYQLRTVLMQTAMTMQRVVQARLAMPV